MTTSNKPGGVKPKMMHISACCGSYIYGVMNTQRFVCAKCDADITYTNWLEVEETETRKRAIEMMLPEFNNHYK